jgi:hypothetical protein
VQYCSDYDWPWLEVRHEFAKENEENEENEK